MKNLIVAVPTFLVFADAFAIGEDHRFSNLRNQLIDSILDCQNSNCT